MNQAKFKIKGMHCKSCELLVTSVLEEIEEISDIKVHLKDQTVKFNYNNEGVLEEAKKAIERENYKVIGIKEI